MQHLKVITVEDVEQKYGRVADCIGGGSGGSIRLHTTLFVIKEFHTQLGSHAMSELVATAMISSPRVLKHHEYFLFRPKYATTSEEFKVSAVMPYGMSLAKVINKPILEFITPDTKSNINPLLLQKYFYGILWGMRDINAHGYYHRDLKPDNVLIVEGNTLICDLGLTKKCQNVEQKEPAYSIGFKAPEIYDDNVNQSEKSESFSAGATFLQMILGYSFFEGGSHFSPSPKYEKYLNPATYPTRLQKFIKNKVSERGMDLLFALLHPDMNIRITITKALEHPYFDDIEEKYVPPTVIPLRSKYPCREGLLPQELRNGCINWAYDTITQLDKEYIFPVLALAIAIFDNFTSEYYDIIVDREILQVYLCASIKIADVIRGFERIHLEDIVRMCVYKITTQQITTAVYVILTKLNYRVDFETTFDRYCNAHNGTSPSHMEFLSMLVDNE
jgi:serine/threonine protein kinase